MVTVKANVELVKDREGKQFLNLMNDHGSVCVGTLVQDGNIVAVVKSGLAVYFGAFRDRARLDAFAHEKNAKVVWEYERSENDG